MINDAHVTSFININVTKNDVLHEALIDFEVSDWMYVYNLGQTGHLASAIILLDIGRHLFHDNARNYNLIKSRVRGNVLLYQVRVLYQFRVHTA